MTPSAPFASRRPIPPAPPTRYPAAADDNQYHLQALRHLYVLAVQRRGVDAVDVDTGESVFVPVNVVLAEANGSGAGTGCGEEGGRGNGGGGGQEGAAEAGHAGGVRPNSSDAADDAALSGTGSREAAPSGGGGDDNGSGSSGGGGGGGGDCSAGGARGAAAGRTVSLVTPCVLPDLKEVSSLSIRSPRYFPVELDVAGNPSMATALQRRCRIYVKRRVGHLSYKNVSGGLNTGSVNGV